MSRPTPAAAPELLVISWRDIPAQVVARAGRRTERAVLSSRFQVAIDRAAMESGLFGTDDYLQQWRRIPRPCSENLAGEVATEIQRLENTYDAEALNDMIGRGGILNPTRGETP